jgi:UDP-GlcNAc:undecaprenyl-phosphate/decaprenyl-phosphate GlcNAc-1-phosphate transferase
MVNTLFASVTAFFISLLLIPIIVRYARIKNLFVAPGHRRIHTKVTPSLGGIAIFIGFVLSLFVWLESTTPPVTWGLVLLIPFVIGFLDDVFHLRPIVKIAGQAIAGTLIFWVLNVRVSSTYGLFGDTALPGAVSYLVTLFIIILITNSFNLIDGIDGLAATFSIVSFLFFGVWFQLANVDVYPFVCFAISGAIMGFLFQNWEPARIFMGDTGSLIIGMVLAIMTIEFLNHNNSLPPGNSVKFESSLGAALCILIIPALDTSRVVVLRLSKGISPFTADKRHVHHSLVRIGKSHRMAVSSLCLVHIFFIGLALSLQRAADWVILTAILVSGILFNLILNTMVANYSYTKK